MSAPTPVRAAPATTTAPPPASSGWPSRAGSTAPSPSSRCAPSAPSRSSSTSARPTPARPTTPCWRWRRTARGVYAAPLRQLAHEAYERLSAQLPGRHRRPLHRRGGDRPGRPDRLLHRREGARCAATCWCSTSRTGSPTPTAATTGPGCVLTGEYREMHLISAAEAYLLLKPLVVRRQEARPWSTTSGCPGSTCCGRRSAPTPCGRRRWSSRSPARPSTPSPPSSTRTGPGKVGVLYGALPPATRRERHRALHQRRARGAGHHRRDRPRHQRAGHDRAVRRDDQVRRRRARARCAPGRPPRSPAAPAATA